jgi:hypothetical protein
VPFTKQPELMLVPIHSAKVMFIGMIMGHFTGKKLPDYFSPTRDDPVGARAIVNGDRDYKKKIGGVERTVGAWIAIDHRSFFTALTASVK